MVFPPRCVCCDARGVPLCRGCAEALEPAAPRDPPASLDAVWSLVDYDGGGRQLVGSLKYDGRRDAIRVLGTAMARLPDRRADVVTWAPTSPSRRLDRGFDQARLLAAHVARALGIPLRGLLVRPEGHHQTGSDRATRLTGPRFTPRRVRAARILLVDDVITTGSTLSAGATALRLGGATEVTGLTLASVR